ncbi:MAG: universal stress protein [Gammaproteobacteria bacterium]
MIKISRILCPVDFSETSKRTFEYGLDLAGQLGSKLDVIHIFQLPAYTLLPEVGLSSHLISRPSCQIDCNGSSMSS